MIEAAPAQGDRVELGRINGAWGTAGWVRVFSLTDPPDNIFDYQPWRTDRAPGRLDVCEWRRQGARLVARLAGIDDRDKAEALAGTALFVDREALPEAGPGRWYWHDLIGLEVVNRQHKALGTVEGLIDVGVHDVLEVRADSGTLLVPFVTERYIDEVDLRSGRIRVDWEPDWSDAQ